MTTSLSFDGRKNDSKSFRPTGEKKTASRLVRWEFAVSRKRENRQMINAKIFDKTGICRFPQAGALRQEHGFAVLTNRGRIYERVQKNDGCKTAFVIFGTPDGNRTHN